jgi:hypothetical protein
MYNFVGECLFKKKDALLQKHHDHMVSLLENGKILPGRAQHQEPSLARPGGTR